MLYFICLLIAFIAVYHKLDIPMGKIFKIWIIGSILYFCIQSVYTGFNSGWNISSIENNFDKKVSIFKVRSNKKIVFEHAILNPDRIIFNPKSTITINDLVRKVVYIDDQI